MSEVAATIKALNGENERLKRELAETREDSERLDWVESETVSGYLERWYAVIRECFFPEARNLRQAIDAAREEKT